MNLKELKLKKCELYDQRELARAQIEQLANKERELNSTLIELSRQVHALESKETANIKEVIPSQ